VNIRIQKENGTKIQNKQQQKSNKQTSKQQ